MTKDTRKRECGRRDTDTQGHMHYIGYEALTLAAVGETQRERNG